MSEFKFSCPNCQQNIAATSEYSGAQISCPTCHTPIIVPGAPAEAPQAHASKLSMAASTTNHPATATAFAVKGPPVRRKKKRTGLYAGLAASACGIAGVIIFWQPLSNFGRSINTKYIHHDAVPLEQQQPTNEPPPPPPELTAEEVLQNVADTYKGLTTYAVKGLSVAAIDASAIKAGQGLQSSTEGVSLELGRTNLYRLEWELNSGGKPFKGAAWSATKGDYVGYGPYPATKSKNRQTALATAYSVSQAQCVALAQLFFDDTNSFARQSSAFARTNGPTLATQINGRNCYVLDGEFTAHDVVLWIDKESFLVRQIQFVFGGKLDDSTLTGLPPAQKSQLTTWSKLKGTITETYQKPETNQNLTASAFEAEFAPTLNPEDFQSQPAQMRPQRQRGASPTSPTQLTRRVRGQPAQ